MGMAAQEDMSYMARLLEPGSRMPPDLEYLVPETKGSVENLVSIPAHKFVLAASSKVFDAQFYGGLNSEAKIRIEDFDAKVFKQMIDFIYGGKIDRTSPVDLRFSLDLYKAADKYDVKELMDEILTILKETEVKKGNIGEYLELAETFSDLDMAADVLKMGIATYLKNTFNGVDGISTFIMENKTANGDCLLSILEMLKDAPYRCSNCKRWPCKNEQYLGNLGSSGWVSLDTNVSYINMRNDDDRRQYESLYDILGYHYERYRKKNGGRMEAKYSCK